MPLSPPIQGGCGRFSDGQKLDNVSATNRDRFVNTPPDSKLRAELKRKYNRRREENFGAEIKQYWKSDSQMSKVVDLMPVIHHDRSLEPLCNKPTMLYWESSALDPDTGRCPEIVFACIYKCWFRCHDNNPDIGFGKFFAHPFQITPTGPQTIPGILKRHAHLCEQAASRLKYIKSGNAESCPTQWSRWQHFHLLPLCRAIIVLLDEVPPSPVRKTDGTVSLDDEVQRQTAVLVLTGYNQDLSGAVNFDTIRSESLPLARHDVSANDSANVIRVSLKTAVQFIAGLQRREERAFSDSKDGSTDTALHFETNGVFAGVNNADKYVEDILDNPSKSESKWSAIRYAEERLRAKERGENLHEREFGFHWRGSWV